MSKRQKSTIEVKGAEITVLSGELDHISLTDIARYKNADHADDVIRNWLRNRNTLEFLGVWERLNNLNFNPVEFDGIKTQAGLNSFTLTPKQWIERTGAIGIRSQAGRYGGPTPIRTSPSSLPPGSPSSSSCISSRNSSVSKTMRIAVCLSDGT